jgi:hypothetical protein
MFDRKQATNESQRQSQRFNRWSKDSEKITRRYKTIWLPQNLPDEPCEKVSTVLNPVEPLHKIKERGARIAQRKAEKEIQRKAFGQKKKTFQCSRKAARAC